MCKVYNTIGSLTALKEFLAENDVHDFNSIKEIIAFQESVVSLEYRILAKHEQKIREEMASLKIDLLDLSVQIEAKRKASEETLGQEIAMLEAQKAALSAHSQDGVFKKLLRLFNQFRLERSIELKKRNYEIMLHEVLDQLINEHQAKTARLQLIENNFDEAVKKSASSDQSELERTKRVVDKCNPLIYGAYGEMKVVKVLESLPDDFVLINDFSCSFYPAIYNKQENDYIKSVQIDHILVGPPGVFIIETKNWSAKSLEDYSLRSPVQQIKRTSYALFLLLNNEISGHRMYLNTHHWGEKKISIKNLIVFTNTKPAMEFKYVKVLSVNELLRYINYFKPIFSGREVQGIADFLLSKCRL